MSFQELSLEELEEKQALVKKLKSELKNEEMALVLLKKLKQSQTVSRETVVSGGATLTPTSTQATGKNFNKDTKGGQYSNKSFDILPTDKLVSIKHVTEIFCHKLVLIKCKSIQYLSPSSVIIL